VGKDEISGYSISLPIFSAEPFPNEGFKIIGEIFGTCFSIGEGFMLTAGHVVREIQESAYIGVVGLLEPESRFPKGAPIVKSEILSCDLGIIEVDFIVKESAKWFSTLSWQQKPLTMLEPVKCVGYPYGLHNVEDRKSLVIRSFQGYIVAAVNRFKPLGMEGEPFSVYELSFQAPRGLSGSPLLREYGKLNVTGVVIGNSKSRMLVLESEEIEKQMGEKATRKTVVEQYESLSLGVAVQAEEIFGIRSELLGDAIGGYFEKNKLLA